jgi:hypothetical protein
MVLQPNKVHGNKSQRVVAVPHGDAASKEGIVDSGRLTANGVSRDPDGVLVVDRRCDIDGRKSDFQVAGPRCVWKKEKDGCHKACESTH